MYWPQLDGLRSLAFIMVFISHLPGLPLSRLNLVGDFLTTLWQGIAVWGWIGVELFFVLSAFLITTLLLQERKKYQAVSFRHFLIRRVLRIWPLYYFFLLLDFLLLPLFFGNILTVPFGSSDWQSFVQHYLGSSLFFLFNFSLTAISLPFLYFQHIHWSVAMEEQFYIVWGAALTKIKKTSTIFWLIPIGLLITMTVRWWIWNHSSQHAAYYYNTFSHLDSILAGIALAALLFTNKIKPEAVEKNGRWLLFLPVIVYLLLACIVPPIQTNQLIHVFLFPVIAFFCGMFVLAVMHDGLGQRIFSRPALVRLGRLTYGMYMFHLLGLAIALSIVSRVFAPPQNHAEFYLVWGMHTGLGLCFTWILAFASWHLLEKRFYNLRYRFSRVPSGFGAEVSLNNAIPKGSPAQ